jgi:hypothetical protein
VRNALVTGQSDREGGVHQRLAELRLGRVVVIEVYWGGILRQQREPDVVGGGHRPPERMPVPDLASALVETHNLSS